MSRHENEHIDFATPDPILTSVFGFTKGAESCDDDDSKCYAKRVDKNNGSKTSTTYYLKFGRGKIFDPWGTYAGRERSADFGWRKVASIVFDQYHKYLKTRVSRHLTQAERMIIDANEK